MAAWPSRSDRRRRQTAGSPVPSRARSECPARRTSGSAPRGSPSRQWRPRVPRPADRPGAPRSPAGRPGSRPSGRRATHEGTSPHSRCGSGAPGVRARGPARPRAPGSRANRAPSPVSSRRPSPVQFGASNSTSSTSVRICGCGRWGPPISTRVIWPGRGAASGLLHGSHPIANGCGRRDRGGHCRAGHQYGAGVLDASTAG